MKSLRASSALVAAACSAVSIVGYGCSEDSARNPSSVRGEQPAADPGSTGQMNGETRAAGAHDSDAKLRSELALIERAEPEPPIDANVAKRLQRAKKVRGPGGAWYYVLPREPEPKATAPLPGCLKRAPQPPGVTARRIGHDRVLATYRIAGGDQRCHAKWIELTVDISDDFSGCDGKRFPIGPRRAGQIVLPLSARLAEADILVASTRTEENSGFASRATTVQIR
jgi:hypothetical protein